VDTVKSVSEWMAERGVSLEGLERATGLDRKVLEAICQGRYTPSPQQRQRVASALGVAPAQVSWGHATAVSHLYGHGPQFGRSP
jgi:transcriptional regulator with XRE-family HTH domain